MPDKDTLIQQATNLMDTAKHYAELDKALDELLEFCMKDWHEFDNDERKDDDKLT